MRLRPETREELAATLRAAHDRREPLGPIDLGQLCRIVRHAPEDLTVTVEGGLTVANLQLALGRHRQWLPVDPPGAERLTIAELIDSDISGPRRFGHGTIREHLIGLRVVLADGRIIHSGGEVVKNVAGYDLMKLFVGARGSLGVVVEAAFKLLPLPEKEAWVGLELASWEHAAEMLDRVTASPLVPVAFDLYRLTPAESESGGVAHLALALAGMRLAVEWQLEQASGLGLTPMEDPRHDAQFHEAGGGPVRQISVLPSRLIESLRGLGEVPFVARAGNGLLRYRGGPDTSPVALPEALLQRVKDTYDPHHIFPEAPRAW